jgi:hypothetical protein
LDDVFAENNSGFPVDGCAQKFASFQCRCFRVEISYGADHTFPPRDASIGICFAPAKRPNILTAPAFFPHDGQNS